MKKVFCLFLLLGFVVLVVAQRLPNVSPLQAMVATELAFAKMSEDQGVRPSFMAFIADDGILFRPKAVKGKQWMTDHPVPASDKRPLLKWYPSFADMARAGDMGYTFGPWEFKNEVSDAQPVGFGHFLTVWKKQNDGTWKFAVDLGISHPQPIQGSLPLELPKKPGKLPVGRLVDVKAETARLIAKDKEVSSQSATSSASEAFDAYSTNDVRLFREGKFPLAGKKLAAATLARRPSVWVWKPEFADVSRSGDLGYSYGTYEIRGGSAKPIETGNYLRIWKKQGGEWKIAVDLANPVVDGKN